MPSATTLLICPAVWVSLGMSSLMFGQVLPDSPGALLVRQQAPASSPAEFEEGQSAAAHLPVCGAGSVQKKKPSGTGPGDQRSACQPENPVQPIVSTSHSVPLSMQQKGELAVQDVIDPFNLLTIVGYSAFAVGENAHSAFGPGLKGWGRLTGYSLVEDAQGEFFGTFVISSVAHEDPRYHRMPEATVKRRIVHALAHTYVSRHDDGRPMPNYATLLTYPISAELANLYVPGIQTNARSTARRIGIGIATDPTGTLVAEFLPDIAKRIHIRAIFIQEILNRVVTGNMAPNVQ